MSGGSCHWGKNRKTCRSIFISYDAGYRYVGRYLTGTVGGTTSKAMTRDEIKSIFAAGLNIFPIFQEGTPSLLFTRLWKQSSKYNHESTDFKNSRIK